MSRIQTSTTLLCLLLPVVALAQFSDSGQVNNEYSRTDPALLAWADQVVSIQRGHQDYMDPGLGLASYGSDTDCLGSTGTPVSLGDGGSITLAFPMVISNGPGDDFAVFENGFVYNGVYMELGFVEVSSNGMDFSRLPSLCRRPDAVGTWGSSDPAEFYNLAGNFVGGTGFDLTDLVMADDPNVLNGVVDLDGILFVRIVDVIGDIEPTGTIDFLGRAVVDPYPTTGEAGGMDLTGAAVINTSVVAVENRTWGGVKSLFR